MRGNSSLFNCIHRIFLIVRGTCIGSFALGFLLIAGAEESQAQQPGAFYIEEVIVTARKREENVQDIPISISAFTGETLEQRQISSSEKLSQVTPNLTFDTHAPSSGHNSAAQIYIRGIGQNEFLPTSDPGVGLYIDGVYIPRAIGGVIEFLDVEHIEILRGPQGTLFGRNTIGGAISIFSHKPTDNLTASASMEFGSDALIKTHFKLSGPLSDNLKGRVSIGTVNQDGYVKRILTGEDLGDQNDLMIRGSLLWTPTDDLEFYFAADYLEEDENGAPLTFGDINTGAPFVAIASGIAGCGNIADLTDPNCANAQWHAGPYANYGTGPVESTLDVWGVSLTATWQVQDWLTVKSITSYRSMENRSVRDADNTPFVIVETINEDDQDQISQEIQFYGKAFDSRLDWLLGFFYFDEEDASVTIANLPVGLLILNGLVKNKTTAVFSQLTYHATDKLSLTAGFRYTEDKKSFLPDQYYPQPFLGYPAGTRVLPEIVEKLNIDEVTPMASLAYSWTEDVMTYLSYSEGFKSGGFNSRNVFPLPKTPTFFPEFADTIEVGWKSTSSDNRLQLNGAFFKTDYTDLQFMVRKGIAPFLFNAGGASIQGFEIEGALVPTDSWLITLGIGYIDAKYDEVDPAVSGVTVDNELPQTPEWSASVGVSYNFDVQGWAVTPRVDFSHQASKYYDALNSPQLFQDGYEVFNAAVKFNSPDQHWTIVVGGTNLTDEDYLAAGTSAYTSAAGYLEHVHARGRQWSLKLKYEFY